MLSAEPNTPSSNMMLDDIDYCASKLSALVEAMERKLAPVMVSEYKTLEKCGEAIMSREHPPLMTEVISKCKFMHERLDRAFSLMDRVDL